MCGSRCVLQNVLRIDQRNERIRAQVINVNIIHFFITLVPASAEVEKVLQISAYHSIPTCEFPEAYDDEGRPVQFSFLIDDVLPLSSSPCMLCGLPPEFGLKARGVLWVFSDHTVSSVRRYRIFYLLFLIVSA